jgi:hypothetical protein
MEGEPVFYGPDDLFEYIDGAADAYLSFEFEQLAAASYAAGAKQSLTIEVYRHRDLRNAFGIYSQEKSSKGKFISLGTEGYYETGVVNFFHGPFYIKLAGIHLGGEDEKILIGAATAVAAVLPGEPRYPIVLECFPAGGRIQHSERYVARDVLGHGFLRSAYSADYEAEGKPVRAYIFEADDEADLARMMDAYVEHARNAGSLSEGRGGSTLAYRFTDPRKMSDGPMHLRTAGRYAWGLFAESDAIADALLDALETNLRERRLID